jgi:outer membrane protein assembly factor BamB
VPAASLTASSDELFAVDFPGADGRTPMRVIDPATGEVTRTLDVDAPLDQVVAGDGVLWAVTDDSHVLRIDPHTGATTSTGDLSDARQLAVAGDAVWVSTETHLRHLDAASGALVATVPLPGTPRFNLAAGSDGAYVDVVAPERDPDGSLRLLLVAVDSATNQVSASAPSVPDHGASAIAAASDAVWTVAGAGPTAVRDPASLEVHERARAGGFAVVTTSQGVWVGRHRELAALDGRARETFSQPLVDGALDGNDMAVAGDRVWVLNEGTVLGIITQ